MGKLMPFSIINFTKALFKGVSGFVYSATNHSWSVSVCNSRLQKFVNGILYCLVFTTEATKRKYLKL